MSTNDSDLLEIAIITYNRHEKLARTLQGLSKSVMGKCRITIYDNASTDNTPEVVSNCSSLLPRLNYVRRPRNITVGPNLILAYAEARAKYFWLLCDDDLIDPSDCDRIYSQLALLKYDAVLLNSVDLPGLAEGEFSSQELKNQNSRLYYMGSFLPSIIYPTSVIEQSVIKSMMIHSMDLFPQIHLVHALVNTDRNYYVHVGNALRREANDDTGLTWLSYTYYTAKSVTTVPRSERTSIYMDRFCAADKPVSMILKSFAYVLAFRGENRFDALVTAFSLPLRFSILILPIMVLIISPRSFLRSLAMRTKAGALQLADSNRI
jgi:glycosyltransferase involved in cell wall biosynthesis